MSRGDSPASAGPRVAQQAVASRIGRGVTPQVSALPSRRAHSVAGAAPACPGPDTAFTDEYPARLVERPAPARRHDSRMKPRNARRLKPSAPPTTATSHRPAQRAARPHPAVARRTAPEIHAGTSDAEIGLYGGRSIPAARRRSRACSADSRQSGQQLLLDEPVSPWSPMTTAARPAPCRRRADRRRSAPRAPR
jgi:hypothetical protein